MNTMTDAKLDSIIRKVQALLDRADHPNTPGPEADLCRVKADAMMLKYKIDSLKAGGGKASGTTPVWKRMRVSTSASEFSNYYTSIASEVIGHVGGRGMVEHERDEEAQESFRFLNAVGFEADLRYAEVLMVSCILEFGKRLEPKYDRNLSEEDNVYNMRNAGMERGRIGAAMWGPKFILNEQKTQNRKVTKLFKRACEARGEDASALLGRGNNMASFRLAYAEGFVRTIRQRLLRIRSERGSESGGLVLKDFSERVNETFYEKYSWMRPREAGTYQDPRQTCEKCKKASSGYCREHGYLKPSKGRTTYLRRDGYDRGATAASMVDLGRNSTPRTNAANERGELG